MKRPPKLSVGDRVAYSANFLRSIGCYTGEMPSMRGTIKEIRPYSDRVILAVIEWDGEKYLDEAGNLPRVNVFNLAKVGTAAMNAQ